MKHFVPLLLSSSSPRIQRSLSYKNKTEPVSGLLKPFHPLSLSWFCPFYLEVGTRCNGPSGEDTHSLFLKREDRSRYESLSWTSPIGLWTEKPSLLVSSYVIRGVHVSWICGETDPKKKCAYFHVVNVPLRADFKLSVVMSLKEELGRGGPLGSDGSGRKGLQHWLGPFPQASCPHA